MFLNHLLTDLELKEMLVWLCITRCFLVQPIRNPKERKQGTKCYHSSEECESPREAQKLVENPG